MAERIFHPAQMLLPAAGTDLTAWAVLACDQFTSQPAYWQQVDRLVGGAPSTLHMVLPEVYLEDEDVPERIEAIQQSMGCFLAEGLLQIATNGFIYIRRHLKDGSVREGLVGCVDLEDYSYTPGAACRIRPSENTVVERIPPRLGVRRGAKLETPHILMLIDDEQKSVIEPLGARAGSLRPLYDFPLMLDGGHLQGWAVEDKADIDAVNAALSALEDPERYRTRYGVEGDAAPFLMAVGDGNHSLATAKAHWEELKAGLDEKERLDHPARFCLVELEIVQSEGIIIEPIHRVVFGADPAVLLHRATVFASERGAALRPGHMPGAHLLEAVAGGRRYSLSVSHSGQALAVGSLEAFLDHYCEKYPATRLDYVHGEESVLELAAGEGVVGILLPGFAKSDLFRGVARGGVLPRKTFSMGHAEDKRVYMECRKIQL